MPKRSQQMKAEELECQSPIRNGIFTLLMQSSNPDLIYTKAFYFDLSDFQHMIDNKVEMIRIEVPSQGFVYQITYQDFEKNFIPIMDPVFGAQLLLPIQLWTVTNMESVNATEA